MDINLKKGKYVVAVSGGVDSTVLLDLLTKTDSKLIVAHFDHVIRKASNKDRAFVEKLAKKYGLKFYFKEGNLGENASEQTARDARYKYLEEIVKKEKADGLITAHHQDDLIETAIINIVRGTGRKGLSSIATNPKVIRPLLYYPKSEITKYANKNKLAWVEDPTNQNDKYLRNYIRHNITPKLDKSTRHKFLEYISKQSELNREIDKELNKYIKSKTKNQKLPRIWLNSLDNKLSREIIAAWLRQNNLAEFDRLTIERLSVDLKTIKPSKSVDIFSGWQVRSTKDDLALEHVER